ncbi:MAG TPA: fatty acid desaturase [Myxococcota bacterium]|jgi:fatty acid desaturase
MAALLRTPAPPAASSAAAASPPDSLERELAATHRPRPAIYWVDFLACVAIGWPAFALAVASWGSGAAWLALGVAVFALYRAALFIHELTHLASGAVPGFLAAWDALAGFPLLVPSLMYVGSHGEHHKAHIFGTAADPEYAPIAHWSRPRLLVATLGMLLIPAALVLRWGLLVPLGALVPAVRRFAITHLSTLAINASYERKPPKGVLKKRWLREELGCMAVVWAAGVALALGALPVRALALWYGLVSAILMINHLRTLGAHRYANEGAAMTLDEQVADSVNLWGPAWLRPLTALLAPVGLRFHALHHFFPTLPYHALGAVHRRLVRELPAGAVYRTTSQPALTSALVALANKLK